MMKKTGMTQFCPSNIYSENVRSLPITVLDSVVLII